MMSPELELSAVGVGASRMRAPPKPVVMRTLPPAEPEAQRVSTCDQVWQRDDHGRSQGTCNCYNRQSCAHGISRAAGYGSG